MRLSRRLFLQSGAAAAATLAVRPSWALGTCSPTGGPRKVLEIFLRGGASQFGAFWYDATLGGATGTGDATRNADDPGHGVKWNEITSPTPQTSTWTAATGSPTLGRTVSPLFETRLNGFGQQMPKLSDYMRVLRVRHELLPHEAAIPYATTGTTLGRQKQSGLGAAIWRRADEANPGTSAIRSLVFQAGSASGDSLAANYTASFGNHTAARRPPIITLGDPDFFYALERANFTATDPVKYYYRTRYDGWMRYAGTPVRSAGFSAYESSLDTMRLHAPALYALLLNYEPTLFPLVVPATYTDNLTRRAIETAVSLLSAGTNDLEHVAVIDGGVEDDYDTHKTPAGRSAATIQNGNLWSVLDELATWSETIIDSQIVVLIHSEFGRKEKGQGLTGTEHHMRGYVNVVISDLITDPDYVGDIGGTDNDEAEYSGGLLPGLSPTDVHAAVAQLAGIDPWDPDMFDRDLACLPDPAPNTNPDPASELLGVTMTCP